MDNEKLTKKDILKKHGPAGGLVSALQKYALMGWILAAVVLVLHFAIAAIDKLAPKPVVAVGPDGTVLGVMEYLSPSSRSDEEILAACKRFVVGYMSMNAETVFEDFADAMNMMDENLLAETEKMLAADNYLARVKSLNARSKLDFSQGGVVIVARNDMQAECRLTGSIVIDTGGTDGPVSKPFDVTLSTQVVARNTANTAGLKIVSRKDN